MIDALVAAGQRLAEALRAENAALAGYDMPRAALMAEAKIRASEAFAAAYAAASRTGARPAGETRRTVADLSARLQTLGTENRRLLEHAVAVQAQVIETIAAAALPRAAAPGYGAAGRHRMPRQAPAFALAVRA